MCSAFCVHCMHVFVFVCAHNLIHFFGIFFHFYFCVQLSFNYFFEFRLLLYFLFIWNCMLLLLFALYQLLERRKLQVCALSLSKRAMAFRGFIVRIQRRSKRWKRIASKHGGQSKCMNLLVFSSFIKFSTTRRSATHVIIHWNHWTFALRLMDFNRWFLYFIFVNESNAVIVVFIRDGDDDECHILKNARAFIWIWMSVYACDVQLRWISIRWKEH